ncbi:MAG: hypothetical protein HFH41_04110 [Lachnospiraceae bacterium]|nr:hypothetical protein [Lachnospiraceae bacterium]
MNGYEQIIKLMREQGAANNLPVPRLAEMKNTAECDAGDLMLDKEDLLIADHLKGKLKEGDTVLIQRVTDDTYAIIERLVEP